MLRVAARREPSTERSGLTPPSAARRCSRLAGLAYTAGEAAAPRPAPPRREVESERRDGAASASATRSARADGSPAGWLAGWLAPRGRGGLRGGLARSGALRSEALGARKEGDRGGAAARRARASPVVELARGSRAAARVGMAGLVG